MSIDFVKLNQFAEKVLEKKKSSIGYPINQNTSLDDFYDWYIQKKLYRVSMNNVGDPCKKEKHSNYSLNTHEFEHEVVAYFATQYGFEKEDHWGFVTTSGTDGNNHGIYAGRKYLQLQSKSAPIIYYSEEVHHSVKNLADVQNTEFREIKAKVMGEMDMDDFAQQLHPSRPALIVIAMGTTFKGAIDDQAAIRKHSPRRSSFRGLSSLP
jgi:histidine decarboxylase